MLILDELAYTQTTLETKLAATRLLLSPPRQSEGIPYHPTCLQDSKMQTLHDQLEIDLDLDGIFENLMHLVTDTPEPDTPPVVQPKPLNTKAMSVQLVTRRPTTVRKDSAADKALMDTTGDAGLTASLTLFKDKTNPVRALLNEVSAVYHYHKLHTLPYIDRGPRLLPVVSYETYRDSMRKLIAEVDARVRAIEPIYDACVINDITFRNRPDIHGRVSTRATAADYPTKEQFIAAFGLDITFAPLPDNSHWLFDIDEEDKRALQVQNMDVYNTALADMKRRIEEPLVKLVETLRVSPGIDEVTGKRMGIFRDTTVTNVVDAVKQVRALSMDDPDVIAACDEVQAALPSAIVDNIDVLRESPVVREAAAARLAAVAAKMGGFFGG